MKLMVVLEVLFCYLSVRSKLEFEMEGNEVFRDLGFVGGYLHLRMMGRFGSDDFC
jgi:hypothetical protein